MLNYCNENLNLIKIADTWSHKVKLLREKGRENRATHTYSWTNEGFKGFRFIQGGFQREGVKLYGWLEPYGRMDGLPSTVKFFQPGGLHPKRAEPNMKQF